MTTALLTGGTGFVGRQVLGALLKRGIDVRAVVRDGSEARLAERSKLEGIIHSADLFAESTPWWERICAGIDTVIHAAWYAEPGQYLQSPKNRECLAGTMNLAAGAAAAGVKRFAGIGTCFEYDLSGGELSVNTPLAPLTPYAQAKADVFRSLSEVLRARNVSFVWCRLFYLYGEGEDSRRLVPYIRDRLSAGVPAELTSGDQVRDYLDVREAGARIAETALGDHEGAVNICSGVPVTVRELAERIADDYDRRDLLHFGARLNNLTDPPKVLGVPAGKLQ